MFFYLQMLMAHSRHGYGTFTFDDENIDYKWKNKKNTTLLEEFEDTKGVIRFRMSKKNKQHNGQKKKYKRTNNDLQNIHIKLKIE